MIKIEIYIKNYLIEYLEKRSAWLMNRAHDCFSLTSKKFQQINDLRTRRTVKTSEMEIKRE